MLIKGIVASEVSAQLRARDGDEAMDTDADGEASPEQQAETLVEALQAQRGKDKGRSTKSDNAEGAAKSKS